jgi:nitrate reductase gamma subunit
MNALNWFIGGPYLYFCLLLFAGVTAWKVYGYATMPRHLRWDLYPLPHRVGGSKYQKVDFHKLKQKTSLWNEFTYMFMEILFIRKAFIHNPKVWSGSFPMHMGLYLSALWLMLLAAGIVVEKLLHLPAVPVNGWFWLSALYIVTVMVGSLALVAGLCGACWLLYLRLSDEGLRDMSDIPAYFNLILLIGMFGSGLAAWFFADPDFVLLRAQLGSLAVFLPQTPAHWLITLEIFFMGLFLAYLPFSRMSHYAAKYFFYHNIMWDDEPMKAGSSLEKDVAHSLGGNLSWSAPHIKQNQSWLAQVSPDEAKAKEGAAKQ